MYHVQRTTATRCHALVFCHTCFLVCMTLLLFTSSSNHASIPVSLYAQYYLPCHICRYHSSRHRQALFKEMPRIAASTLNIISCTAPTLVKIRLPIEPETGLGVHCILQEITTAPGLSRLTFSAPLHHSWHLGIIWKISTIVDCALQCQCKRRLFDSFITSSLSRFIC